MSVPQPRPSASLPPTGAPSAQPLPPTATTADVDATVAAGAPHAALPPCAVLSRSWTEPRVPSSIPEIRHGAVAALDGWPLTLGPGAVADAALLVSELVTNAVLHGCGDELTLRLSVPQPGDTLLVEAVDGAATLPPQPRRPLPVLRQPRLDEESGRGLLLVDVITEHCWGIAPSPLGTHVWAVLTLFPTPESGASPAVLADPTGPDAHTHGTAPLPHGGAVRPRPHGDPAGDL